MYLGLDPSLNGTGMCLLDADGGVLRLETISVGERRGAERLAFIEERVLEVLEKSSVLFVAIENYAYDSCSRHFDLGEIGGVLRLLVFKRHAPMGTVAPAALKKFAVGDSTADKEAMLTAARSKGIDARDDNQADAFFLADIARHLGAHITPRRRAQLEVLEQIEHPKTRPAKRRLRRLVKNAL